MTADGLWTAREPVAEFHKLLPHGRALQAAAGRYIAAVSPDVLLRLLDALDEARRERDAAKRDARELRFLWEQRGERANKAEDERDAAVALLQRRGRALVAIESIARNSETAGVLPDIARIAADALLGGEGV